jgi:polyferredoxin
MKIIKNINIIRSAVQIIFLILMGVFTVNFPRVTMGIVGSMIIGVAFCGWYCPFGALQDFLNFIRKKMHIRGYEFPDGFHKKVRFVRYFIALAFVFFGTSTIMVFLGSYNARSIFIRYLYTKNITVPALIVLCVVILITFFSRRFFCRYICPVGGQLALRSLVRPFTIQRDEQKCIKCLRCDKACPVKIKVSEVTNMANPDCMACFRCVSICPVDALSMKRRKYFKKNLFK